MREQNPFKIPPNPSILAAPMQGFVNNYIDIDAKAQFFDEDDVKLAEVPFTFDKNTLTFVPLSKNISWEEVRELAIVVDINYDIVIPLKSNGSGSCKISQKWRVKYGDKGVLLEAAILEDLGSRGEGEFAVSVDVKTDQPTTEAILTSTTLLLKLVGGYKDDGVSIGLAVSHAGVTKSVGGSTGAYSKTYKLKLGLLAVNQPKPAIQVPEELLRHTAWFDRENQSDLDPVELRRLEDNWVGPLRSRAPELAAAIQSRSCPIYVTGYASVTGHNEAYNRELSANRIISVENALKSLFDSKDIMFVPTALGQSAAKQKGPSPQEKRVDITIPREYAERAIAAGRK